MLVSSLVRLIIYLNKLYQDYYNYNDQDFYFALISIAALVTPPLIYSYLTAESLLNKMDIDTIDLSTRTVNGLLLIPWQIKRYRVSFKNIEIVV
ncbi:hypothetical protein B4U80_00692, partial [Leptotrombidium deliense]